MAMVHVDISNVAQWLADAGWHKNSWSEYPTVLSPWESARFYYRLPGHIRTGDILAKTNRNEIQVIVDVADFGKAIIP